MLSSQAFHFYMTEYRRSHRVNFNYLVKFETGEYCMFVILLICHLNGHLLLAVQAL
jgi:hypothetical protein